MARSLVSLAVACASFLFVGVKSEATLKLTPQYPNVGTDLLLECVTSKASDFESIRVLQLRDARNLEAVPIYETSSSCNPLPVYTDHPRIIQTNSGKLELRWTNMSQLDTGRYYCYVENCARETDRSKDTQITVIMPPSYVNITPAGDITAKEGSTINLNIACHANVGSPNGSLSLTRSGNGTVQLLDLTLLSTGSEMTGTYSSTEVANRSRHDDVFQCKAVNQLDSSKFVESAVKYLKVSYQPLLQVFSVPELPVQSNGTSHSLTVPSFDFATIVHCRGNSNPQSQMFVILLSGNQNLVRLNNGSERATIEVKPASTNSRLLVRCTAQYAAAAYPETDTAVSTDIIIDVVGTEQALTTPKVQEVQSDDALVWIIVGVVCGILLLVLVCAFIVWCLMYKKQGKDPNAAATGNVVETVVPVNANARAVNAEPDYDIRKEFPPDLLYLADEPKSRRPIVDYNAQSMFEYLGNDLVAVRAHAYTEKTPYETEINVKNAHNDQNDQFDQYKPNVYTEKYDPNQLAANQYDVQSSKQTAYNANQAYDNHYHNQAKQPY